MYLHPWMVPALLTIACVAMMLKPLKDQGDYSRLAEAVWRLFWLIPISLIWTMFFAWLLWRIKS